MVYYYCSVDTFVRIVTNKTLWLTNLFFLNDSGEHFWLRNKAQAFISRQIERHPHEFGYQYLATLLGQEWRQDIYCACFSEQPDRLSQWRAYADDGKGFAVGFSTNHLLWLAKNLQGSFADVVYGDTDHDALIEKAFELYPRLCDGEDPTIEEAAGDILGRIFEAASRCKSQSFCEEAEWRLVCERAFPYSPDDETIWTKATIPRYIARRDAITPYIEIPLVEGECYQKRGMEPIKEVYFGPKNTGREQEYAIEGMLSSGGFKRVRLVRSSVTYR